MPDRAIDAAAARLDEAVSHQERLVAEVMRLRRSNRWLTGVVAFGVVGLVGIGTAVAFSLEASDDAQNAVNDVAALVLQIEEGREANRLEVCRSRNSAYAVARNDLGSTLMFLVGESDDQVAAGALFDRLVAEAWTPIETFHTDCDRDGVLTVDDYGDIVPDGLPLEIP